MICWPSIPTTCVVVDLINLFENRGRPCSWSLSFVGTWHLIDKLFEFRETKSPPPWLGTSIVSGIVTTVLINSTLNHSAFMLQCICCPQLQTHRKLHHLIERKTPLCGVVGSDLRADCINFLRIISCLHCHLSSRITYLELFRLHQLLYLADLRCVCNRRIAMTWVLKNLLWFVRNRRHHMLNLGFHRYTLLLIHIVRKQ